MYLIPLETDRLTPARPIRSLVEPKPAAHIRFPNDVDSTDSVGFLINSPLSARKSPFRLITGADAIMRFAGANVSPYLQNARRTVKLLSLLRASYNSSHSLHSAMLNQSVEQQPNTKRSEFASITSFRLAGGDLPLCTRMYHRFDAPH
mgnify:CR=1 FL=1